MWNCIISWQLSSDVWLKPRPMHWWVTGQRYPQFVAKTMVSIDTKNFARSWKILRKSPFILLTTSFSCHKNLNCEVSCALNRCNNLNAHLWTEISFGILRNRTWMWKRTISTKARHRPALQAIEVTRTTVNSPTNIAFTILPRRVLRHMDENHVCCKFCDFHLQKTRHQSFCFGAPEQGFCTRYQ